ncbi:MAG: cohesin domain-containing protein, partial [Clostridiales bacterium]|nr:cohesin domain-containing protein [Clostridiales bacterium]
FPGVIFNANQMKAANVHHDYDKNGDPYISIKDGVRLSQLLAGYQFETSSAISLMSMENINISVENSEAYPGEYISIPVRISNNTGISGFKFGLSYDSEYLTPISISNGEIIEDGLFASNLYEDTDVSTLDEITVYWNTADSMCEDGILFTVDFLVGDNVSVGQNISVGLTYETNDICNCNLETVGANVTDGYVTVVTYTDEADDVLYDYYINDAYVDTEDEEVSSFPVKGNFDLTVAVQGEYDAEVEASMFVACYDETGKMLSIKDIALTEDILTAGSGVVHIDESKTDISDIKIFIWKANTLIPLAESFAL